MMRLNGIVAVACCLVSATGSEAAPDLSAGENHGEEPLAPLEFHVSPAAPLWLLRFTRSDGGDTLESADIVEAGTGKEIQKLDLNLPYRESWDSNPSYIFQDVNFDGFKDIALFSDAYAGPNTSFAVWLYDPAVGRYEYNTEISGLLSFSINPEDKTVSSTNSCCAGLSVEGETYRWRGKHLELIERVVQEPLEPQPDLPAPASCPDPTWVSRTAEKLVHGRLRKVRTERFPMCG